jgi:hypothetical protein
MTLLSRVLSHPAFPTYLRKHAALAYETVNSRGEAEVWLDLPESGYLFYLDADRNPAQVTSANLIVGGRKPA